MPVETVITAIDAIIRIGIAIHDKIQQLKANKEQCTELYNHITIVIGQLDRLGQKKSSTSPEFVQAIFSLKACVVKSEKLILKYSSERNWLVRVWRGGSNERSFNDIHEQLSRNLQQMCLAVGIDLLVKYEENAQAVLNDRAHIESILLKTLNDTAYIKEQASDIVKQQLTANESLTRMQHGQQVIETLQQNGERKLIELLEGQKKLSEDITRNKPLNNTSYKIRFDEINFGREIPLRDELKPFYALYEGKLNGQPITVKLIHGDHSNDEILIREAKILSNLHCNKIINLLGACFEEKGALIVMESAENGSLEDLIKSKLTLSAGLKERIAKEIILGLQYLHTKKVFYKTFNAGSVLFSDDWRVKLANFSHSSAQAFSIGSVSFPVGEELSAWLAPELSEDKLQSGKMSADAKRAADIYSLGLVLWSLWANKLPTKNTPAEYSFEESISQDTEEKSNVAIPKVFQEIIKKCWAIKPEVRPNIDDIVKLITFDAFSSLIAGEEAARVNFEKELITSVNNMQLIDYYQNHWGKHKINGDDLNTPPSNTPKPTPTFSFRKK